MTSEEMLKQIAALPKEAHREIEDFIVFLKSRYAARQSSNRSFENETFFGIWRDREDMTDSTAWVRSIRKEHWAN